jgi:hypothetical protein
MICAPGDLQSQLLDVPLGGVARRVVLRQIVAMSPDPRCSP